MGWIGYIGYFHFYRQFTDWVWYNGVCCKVQSKTKEIFLNERISLLKIQHCLEASMKKRKIVVMGCIFLTLFLISTIILHLHESSKEIPTEPTQIIQISVGGYYGQGDPVEYEYFVVVNPPEDLDAIRELIVEYDKSHPITDLPPFPSEKKELRGYTRFFFRECKKIPRDIEFDFDEASTELGERFDDRISSISSYPDFIVYHFFLKNKRNIQIDSYSYREDQTDPTVNGLYNNVTNGMITE